MLHWTRPQRSEGKNRNRSINEKQLARGNRVGERLDAGPLELIEARRARSGGTKRQLPNLVTGRLRSPSMNRCYRYGKNKTNEIHRVFGFRKRENDILNNGEDFIRTSEKNYTTLPLRSNY